MFTKSRLTSFWNLFRAESSRGSRRARRRSNQPQRTQAAAQSLEAKSLLTAIAWDGGGDGTSFADALNWSTDTVPGAADDVSIGAIDGNPFIVNLSNSRTLNSLNINSDDATLNLPSSRQLTLNADSAINAGNLQLAANARVIGTGRLTNDGSIVVNGFNARITPAEFIQNGDLSIGVAGGVANVSLILDSFSNHGNLNLGTSANTASLSLNAGQTFTNAADAKVVVDSTVAGDARIQGDVINLGDFDVVGNLLQNEAGSTFSQNGGTLAIDGSMEMFFTTFEANAGVLDGANSPLVEGGTLRFDANLPAGFTIDTQRNATIDGDLPAGQTVRVIAAAADGRLTTNNDFINAGTILLQRDGASTRRLLIGTQFNSATSAITNTGVIDVAAGGDFEITAGDLINEGTFTLNGDMQFRGTRSIINTGTFTIAAGAEANITAIAGQVPVFVQQDGNLDIDGDLNFSSSTFTFNGGDISANDTINMSFGTLEVSAGNTNAFDVSATGTLRLIGDLLNNTQQLTLNAAGASQARLNVDNDFSNSGILTLGGEIGATGSVSLNVLTGTSTGVLTNNADGIIDINDGGTFQFLSGDIVNEGTVELDRDFDFRGTAKITNRGSWTVEDGSTQTILAAFGQIPEFVQESGSLHAGGTFRVQAARFNFEGGMIDPSTVIEMAGGTLAIADGNTNAIDVDATGFMTLTGNLANASQTIEMNAVGTTVGQLTVDNDFVNSGVITLGELGGSTAAVRLRPVSTSIGSVITNGPNGVIEVNPGGTFDTQNNSLLNEGTFLLDRDFEFRGVQTLTNRGDWTVEDGSTLAILSAFGQVPDFVQADGNLQIDGDLEVRSAEFTFDGGNINGNIPLIQSGTLNIAANNDNAATFRVVNNGSFTSRSTLTTDLNENQTILLETQGTAANNSARLQVPDGFENNGTIRLTQEAGAIGTSRLVSSDFNGAMTNGPSGRLEGVGEAEFSQLTNDGAIAPGDGTGLFTIDADFDQSATGSVEIELDGLTPQTEFDVLQIDGDAVIDGDLNLLPAVGFTPAIGTTFDVINYDSAAGDFSFVNGTDLGNGTLLEKSTNAAEVRLTVRIPPQLTVSDVTIIENDAGTVDAVFTVTLEQTSNPVRVDFATSAGTANENEDFIAVAGTLNFAANETTKTVTVPIVGDLRDEDSETFDLVLSNAINAASDDPVGTATIVDNNDPQPEVSFTLDSQSNPEATSPVLLDVELSRPSGVNVTIDFAVTGGTATGGGDDFTLASGTLTFAPDELSKTISIDVVDDLIVEASETIEVTLSTPVRSTLGAITQHTVTIVNDDAPIVIDPIADVTVDEDAADTLIDITDVFNSNEVPFSVTSSDGSLVTATLNGLDLTLSFAADQNGAASITVIAGESGLQTTVNFAVTVNAVNDAPTVAASIADVTVDEDAADKLIDLSGVFNDIDSANLTLTAVSSDGTLVTTSLNGTDLTLSFAADQNGAATVTVTADDGDLTVNATFAVTVNAVNDAPTVIAPIADVTVDEDAPDEVIDLSGVFDDIDSANLTLTAVSSDGTLVSTSLNGTDLTLSFAADQNGAATVTVTADDGDLTASDTFAVTVNAVNDAPTVAAPIADVTVDEDAADEVIDLSGVFDDIDSANLTLTAVSSDGTLVSTSLNGTDLTLSFAADQNGAATVTVTADDGDLTVSDTFAVTVNAVNDAPTVAAPIADVTVDEDAADQVIDLSGVFEDIDSANLTLTAVSSDGTLVSTSLNGTDLALSFAADQNGAATVTVTANDGDLTVSETFAVTVNAVNDAPTVAAPIANVTVDEDAADEVIDLSGVFDDIDSANLTLSAVSSDSTLVSTSVDGTDLTLSFAADQNGAATVTVTADDGDLTVSDTFTVSVNAVNDAPTVAAPLADVTVDEDAADEVIDLSGVFSDIDSANLILTAVSSDGTLVSTSVDGTDLTLSFAADQNGAASVTITADDGDLTASDTFAVTVNAVNDAGTFNGDLTATVNEGSSVSGTATFSDAADGFNVPNFVLNATANNGTATINADGTWNYSPNAAFSGTDTFAIEVTDDDGNVESRVIAITVTPDGGGGNDDPVRLENGVLIVEGDQSTKNFKDQIRIRRTGGDNLKVKVRSGNDAVETFTFPIADVDSIRITAGEGNDKVRIDDGVLIPVEVDGGAGNDFIQTGGGDDAIVDMFGNNEIWSGAGNDVINTGDGHDWIDSGSGDDLVRAQGGRDVIYAGSGHDIVVGGSGYDLIFGGSGRDILIGGDRSDVIFGGSGQDILIGGWTAHDNNDEALNAIRDEWTFDRSIRTRVRNIWNGSGSANRANGNFFLNNSTIFDDNDYDLLFGGYGTDWYPGC